MACVSLGPLKMVMVSNGDGVIVAGLRDIVKTLPSEQKQMLQGVGMSDMVITLIDLGIYADWRVVQRYSIRAHGFHLLRKKLIPNVNFV